MKALVAVNSFDVCPYIPIRVGAKLKRLFSQKRAPAPNWIAKVLNSLVPPLSTPE